MGVLKLADFGLAIDLTREAAVTCAGTVGELQEATRDQAKDQNCHMV